MRPLIAEMRILDASINILRREHYSLIRDKPEGVEYLDQALRDLINSQRRRTYFLCRRIGYLANSRHENS